MMEIDHQETQILNLVQQLPILKQMRLALTILMQIEPSQIPIDDFLEAKDRVSTSKKSDEELAQHILNRKESYLKGGGENISRQELMKKIDDHLSDSS